MRCLLHKIVLRIKRNHIVLPAVHSVREHKACLSRISKLSIKYPFELLFQSFIIYRTNDLYTPVKVSRHKVGRTYIEIRILSFSEFIYPCMLKIPADYARNVYILRMLRYLRQNAAYTSYDHVDFNSGSRSFAKLIYNLSFGNGIGFYAYISVSSEFYLFIYLITYAVFDSER